MTLVAPAPAAFAAPRAGRILAAPALAVALGAALYAATQIGPALGVWTQGLFADTDDAMRIVQVREWMAGKPWFDFSVARMSPPEGFRTHWSHVVDLPVAGLIKLFGLALDPMQAERAARIAFPGLCFVALLAALVALGRRLLGPQGGLAAAGLAPFAYFAMQFRAGRVDHHAPQLTLLAALAYALIRSLDPGAARWAAAAGGAAALSLAISVENLPFLAAVAGVYAILAAAAPARARPAAWFGAAFAAATPAAWAIFADRAAGPVCDALSTFHVALAIAGGLGLAAVALAAPRLPAFARWAALAALGGALLGLAAAAFPACLRDPLAAVPPLAVEFWLSRVTEAEPLLPAFRHQPIAALAIAMPILCALAALPFAARAGLRAPDDADAATARLRWLALAALLAVGAAATLWQLRAGGSTQILATLAGAAACAAFAPVLRRRGLAPFWSGLAAVPFAALFWVAVAPAPAPAATAATGPAAASEAECLAPAALAALDRLPPGLVLSSLDPGSHILAATRHTVLGGAYHRNARGNVDALTTLLGPPEAAAAALRARGVDYLAICPGLQDLSLYALLRPGSLAAALLADAAPAGLERLPLDGLWRVYRSR